RGGGGGGGGVVGGDGPAAIAVVDAPVHGPASGNAGDRHRDRTNVAGRVTEAEVDWAAGNARRKGGGGEFKRAARRIAVAVHQHEAHGLAAEVAWRLEGEGAG